MKRIIILLAVSFIFINIYAKEVPLNTAKEYADKFMAIKSRKMNNTSEICVFQKGDMPYTYVVNYKPQGWVLLSADDCAPSIIAYSEEGNFDVNGIKSLPFYFWFKNYEDQIKNIINSKQSKVHQSWSDVNFFSTTKGGTKAVNPLINVTWNQGSGWNQYCPSDSRGPGGHVYAGCVAVAMAQCMSVYQYPTTGYSNHSYTSPDYGYQYVDYSKAEYKWDSMGTSGANKYVALLLYHLGVSVNMGYGYDGSGAYSTNVPNAIKTYFDYSNQARIVSRSSYTDANWINLLINELNNGRPIYYSGDNGSSGHAFNIDGVNESELFHLNWGWSGSYNGYYSISSLAPGSSAGFDYNQDAIINFMPRDNRPYDISLSNSSVKEKLPINTVVGVLTASDETPDDVHTFEVIAPDDIFGNPGYVPFSVDGNKLVTTEVLNYSSVIMYEIIIKVTDKTDNTFQKSFIINVLKESSSDVTTESGNEIKLYFDNNSVNFTLKNNFSGEFSINIYDALGRTVSTYNFNKQSGEYSNFIQVDKKLSGFYLVSFNFKGSIVTKKLIVN